MKLRIEKAIYGGRWDWRAFSRKERQRLFVPGTLPGELVEVTFRGRISAAFATRRALVPFLEPSPEGGFSPRVRITFSPLRLACPVPSTQVPPRFQFAVEAQHSEGNR